jgi:hypothetical protein
LVSGGVKVMIELEQNGKLGLGNTDDVQVFEVKVAEGGVHPLAM